MDERIEQIQELLAQVAQDLKGDSDRQFMHNFDALELPSIVSGIVRYLQPPLGPIEAAVYWHMFDRSILSSGQQYCRVSTSGMGSVVRSSRGATEMSYNSIQTALKGLQQIGALLQSGEPNRDGTLYKVLLPEEIPVCVDEMRSAEAAAEVPIPDEKAEGDFYNVPANRLRVFERDEYKCRYCGKQLTRFTATLDHLQPVSEAGNNSFDNLATACLHCNSRRGARPVMDAVIGAKGISG